MDIKSKQVIRVVLPNGPFEDIGGADVIGVEGGALILYKTIYLGKAGSCKAVVKAYGAGHWVTVERVEVT